MIENIPKYGIFSPDTLALYQNCEGESSLNLLKRSSILFDKLILIPYHLDDKMEFNVHIELFKGEEQIKEFDEFSSIFLSVNEFGDDFFSKKIDPSEYSINFQLNLDNYKRYDRFISSYVKKKFKSKTNNILSRGDLPLYESIIKCKLLDDFNCLLLYTFCIKRASGLFTQIHEDALIYTMDNVKSKIVNKLINQIEKINYFDFGTLSWNEIIELRKSNFVKDFRRFVDEWYTSYKTTQFSKKNFEMRLYKFINDSKFSFIAENAPKPMRSILSGIFGNFPLLIPLNPVSIGEAINNIEKQNKMVEKYSWLLFIQKAYKMDKGKD